MKGKLFTLCSVLLLAASCSTDDYADPGTDAPDGQIRFEISFAPFGHPGLDPGSPATEHKILSQAQDDIPITRVETDTKFNSTWQDGDAIGIFAVAHGSQLAPAGNPIHNVRLTYTGGKWTGPAYWPSKTGSYDFYAYYPYDAALTDPTQLTFSAATDQSIVGGSSFNLSDLLYARPSNQSSGYTRGQSVSLSFVHAMALVEVKVGSSMFGNYASALAVTLNGCFTTQTLNLAAGSLSNPSDPKSIRMYPCLTDDATGTYSYRALVAAGTTVPAETSLFRFSYCDKEVLVSPKLPAELALTPGRAETFSIDFPFMSVAVSATGRIADLIPEAERANISSLRVTGEMTADDFYTIRDHLPNITALDLSQASVEGNAIPEMALCEKMSLQEFIFPAGITAIGGSAFEDCKSLTGSLTIPASVTTIGSRAFNGCRGFTDSLTISEGVTSIGDLAFLSCKGFTGSLTIPASVTTIGYGAFETCGQITSITCHIATPGNVSFGDDVFHGMREVTAVYVPAAAVDAYKAHPSWSLFANIIQPIPNNN